MLKVNLFGSLIETHKLLNCHSGLVYLVSQKSLLDRLSLMYRDGQYIGLPSLVSLHGFRVGLAWSIRLVRKPL